LLSCRLCLAATNASTVEQHNLGKLKRKFKGNDEEWAAILAHFLLQKPPQGEEKAMLHGVRMVYSLKNNNLELSIRRDVQGIKVIPPCNHTSRAKLGRSHWGRSSSLRMKNWSSTRSTGRKHQPWHKHKRCNSWQACRPELIVSKTPSENSMHSWKTSSEPRTKRRLRCSSSSWGC